MLLPDPVTEPAEGSGKQGNAAAAKSRKDREGAAGGRVRENFH